MAALAPVRAAIITAVSPAGVNDASGSAPALSRRSIIGALPLMAASCSGNTPSRVRAATRAPARISASAMSRSSRSTAQCRAVVPSTCGRLTSARRASAARTASRSPRIAASATSAVAARAAVAPSSSAATQQERIRVIVRS